MKITLQCTALLFALTFSLAARAQNAADEKSVWALSQEAMNAFDAFDADRFAAVFSENADFLSPLGHLLHGRTAIHDNHARLFKMWSDHKPEKVAHEITQQHVRFLSPDLALLTMTDKSTQTTSGKDESSSLSFLMLARRTNGKWLIESVALTPVVPMGEPGK